MRHDISRSDLHQKAASRKAGIILSFDLGGSHVAAMAASVSNPLDGREASLVLHEGGSAA